MLYGHVQGDGAVWCAAVSAVLLHTMLSANNTAGHICRAVCECVCRHKDPTLLQQIIQGLPFACFVSECSTQQDPSAWLKAAESFLTAWRYAEQQLLAAPAWEGQGAGPQAAAAVQLTQTSGPGSVKTPAADAHSAEDTRAGMCRDEHMDQSTARSCSDETIVMLCNRLH